MKVITKGIIPTYIVKCFDCHSVIEYDRSEEHSTFIKDVAWFGDCTDWYITCPVCKSKIPTRSLTSEGSYDWRIKK